MYIYKEILGGHTRVVNVAGLPMLQGHSIGKYDRHTFINVLQVVMLHGLSTIRVEIVDL